jgi:hypothetical protein
VSPRKRKRNDLMVLVNVITIIDVEFLGGVGDKDGSSSGCDCTAVGAVGAMAVSKSGKR